jgi:hypothetical protein
MAGKLRLFESPVGLVGDWPVRSIRLTSSRYLSAVSNRRRIRRLPASQLPAGAAGEPEPERLLLDQIAAGELDAHLVAIAEAVRARHELLQTISSQKMLATLNVGDRVRINRHASPQYLHGIHGTVVELDRHAAVVCVHRPIGRFKSGEIRCPPLVLDRLNPAA